ncbi:MAG: cyclic nucleotide-binding domain-containing protein [Halobacteriovoraceae bacterium]|nr:cyclic nucleotide-binding domain-containing protein [Halobacteriovoraceae bacterium]
MNDGKKETILSNGEILFHEGDDGGSIFLVVSGNIRIYKYQNGSEVVLSNMKEGEVIGTLSLLPGHKRTAHAKAIGVTKVKEFSTHHLTDMLNSEVPKWYQTILKDIIARFAILEENYLKTLAENNKLRQRL